MDNFHTWISMKDDTHFFHDFFDLSSVSTEWLVEMRWYTHTSTVWWIGSEFWSSIRHWTSTIHLLQWTLEYYTTTDSIRYLFLESNAEVIDKFLLWEKYTSHKMWQKIHNKIKNTLALSMCKYKINVLYLVSKCIASMEIKGLSSGWFHGSCSQCPTTSANMRAVIVSLSLLLCSVLAQD